MKNNMKILVNGVKGQLGFDVVKELKNRGYTDILECDINELDITNDVAVNEYISFHKPDIIFHNAAYTAVDKAEDESEICYNVNTLGTKYLALAAKKINCKFVYISTDYVFDGTKNGFYETTDSKNPLSVYGKTKSLGEDVLIETLEKYFIVRISWVFGKNGNNFIKTMLKLSETRTELNVVSDQFGSPTYTVDLAKLLCDMIKTDKYGIYHATNENTCSWHEFAKEIFRQAKKNVTVNSITSEMYPVKAVRPKNSKMSKQSLVNNGFAKLPTWQNAITRYLKEIEVL